MKKLITMLLILALALCAAGCKSEAPVIVEIDQLTPTQTPKPAATPTPTSDPDVPVTPDVTEPPATVEPVAAPTVITAEAKGSNINVRSSASTTGEVAGKLNSGDEVTVIGQNGGWYQVENGALTGFVKLDYLTVTAITGDDISIKGYINATSVNLRESAASAGAVVAKLNKNSEVTVTGFTSGWYAVSCADGVGYVSADYVVLNP